MPRIRVLFADADAAFGVYARYSLEQLGFQVTVANDGADLLARFVPDYYDVVLVGLDVPLFDGWHILRAVKQRSATTPVILLCDSQCAPLAEQALQEGAFAYFEKPINDFTLLGNAIQRAMARGAIVSPDQSSSAPSDPFIHTLYTLIESTRTRPLSETLQFCVTAAAGLASAPHCLALLAHGAGFQVFSAFGFGTTDAARQDVLTQLGEELCLRLLASTSTMIEPLSDDLAERRAIGIPMRTSETHGALVLYPLVNLPAPTCLAQLEVLAAHGALAIEVARLREDALRLSSTDPLTGVLKREAFLGLADREFRRSWRYNHPISVIIIDIDNFSEINAEHGYAFGNQVLQLTAQTCVNIIRSIDLIGRYGGDAFAILLVMTEGEGARTVAERLRVGINALHPTSAAGTLTITASLGVCSYPRSGCSSIFDLLTLAQEAQYAARYRGPNEIVYC